MPDRPPPGAAEPTLLDPDGAFVKRLRADRAALAELSCELRAAPDEAGRRPLAGLVVLAHRLAGAAGTFGYGRVGHAAQALEDAAAGRRRRSAVDAAIGTLRLALDEALGPQ